MWIFQWITLPQIHSTVILKVYISAYWRKPWLQQQMRQKNLCLVRAYNSLRRYQNFSQKTLSLNEASQIVRRNSIFLSMNDFKNWYSCFSQFVFNSCQLDLGSVVKEVEVEIIIYQNTSILRDYLLICHYIHSVFKHLLRTYFCQTFGWSWTYKSE